MHELSYNRRSCLVRNEELVCYHQPEELGKGKYERGDPLHMSCWNPSWLSNELTPWKDVELEWLARESTETNCITTNTGDSGPPGRAVPQDSLTLLHSPWQPFAIMSLALSAHIASSDNSFLNFRKEPTLGLEGIPFPETISLDCCWRS